MYLTPEEGRVIGSLIEKQLTTPQQYPLTLNALVGACNQSSNREPVVSYDEHLVQTTLASLRNAELIGIVYPSHGRSVTRYRHVLTERLGLDDRELALLAVLLLRGPQTAGELRARSERMARFDGIDAVDADLVRLSEKAEPLVIRQPRRPGQKEERWAQLLSTATPAPAAEEARAAWSAGGTNATAPTDAGASTDRPIPAADSPTSADASPIPTADSPTSAADSPAPADDSRSSLVRPTPPPPPGFPSPATTDERLAFLAEEVANLRAEVSELRDAVDLFRDQLGG